MHGAEASAALSGERAGSITTEGSRHLFIQIVYFQCGVNSKLAKLMVNLVLAEEIT